MRPVSCGIFIFLLFTFSCHFSADNQRAGLPAGISDLTAGKVMGVYTGNFNKGLITLAINYISGVHVSGYNIHKGLRRNINGVVQQKDGVLEFVLKEPGDNPMDGTFYLSQNTESLAIKGKWVPFDSTKTGSKRLTLTRQPEEEVIKDDNQWTTVGGGDTTLTFNNNGTCEYAFYERPEDSTSQLVTVRGNYERKVDTFRIEWQKNTHTPAQTMKLVISHTKEKGTDGDDYETRRLQGHGLEFQIFIGE